MPRQHAVAVAVAAVVGGGGVRAIPFLRILWMLFLSLLVLLCSSPYDESSYGTAAAVVVVDAFELRQAAVADPIARYSHHHHHHPSSGSIHPRSGVLSLTTTRTRLPWNDLRTVRRSYQWSMSSSFEDSTSMTYQHHKKNDTVSTSSTTSSTTTTIPSRSRRRTGVIDDTDDEDEYINTKNSGNSRDTNRMGDEDNRNDDGTGEEKDPPVTNGNAVLSATASTLSTTMTAAGPVASQTTGDKKVSVRRTYETFLWFYESNEYNVNYRVEGPVDGPPILLVHGFGANVNHYRYQFPALVEQGYRVYAIDLLGFGASDKPPDEDYSIELFAALCIDFITSIHPDQPWMIAGNSIGGLVSLAATEQLPKLIQGVILFNCAGGMSGFRYEDIPVYLRPVLYFMQKVVLGPQLGGRFFERFKTRENVESILRAQGVYRDQTNVDDELLEILLGPSDDEGAEAVFLKVFAGPPGPTPESILPSIQCPVLALWGSQDPWTPVDAGMHPGNAFGRYMSGDDDTGGGGDFTLEVLQGAGHCPHDECPDVVNRKMIAWMKQVRERYDPTS